MAEKVSFKIDSFEIEKDVRSVEMELPFGVVSFDIDFKDTTISNRVSMIMEMVKENQAEIQKSDNTKDKEEKALDVIKQIRNAADFVFDIKICDSINQKIDPFTTITSNDGQEIFSVFLVKQIFKQVSEIKKAEELVMLKNQMKEVVSQNA